MTRLPVHPRTRMHAIGLRRDGRPIWPVMGGDGTTPQPEPTNQPAPTPEPTPTPPPAPAPPTPPGFVPSGQPATGQPEPEPKLADEPLGEGGKKALAAERERRKETEQQMADLKKQLEALQPAAEIFAQIRKAAVPEEEKSDTERLQEEMAQLRLTAETERMERFRAEVAAEKGLTREQAARLVGKTREDLAADAEALLALFPKAPAVAPEPAEPAPNGQPAPPASQVPKPDPSQGARGPVDINAQIQEALAKGDIKTHIALERQRAAQAQPK